RHTQKQRYTLMAKDLRGIAERLLICGMHVHVGIEDPDLRIDIFNQLPYFLPHLLTLSTSSPFWQGRDTGLKCYRLTVFDALPRTGLPETFSSFAEYRRTVEILIQSQVIEDASKIWWDLRPSSRFPTLEMRITDVATDIDDALALAALYRCLVRMLFRLRRDNQRWRAYSRFLINENRWRAQRYGLEKGMVDFGTGEIVDFSYLVEELMVLTAPDAEYFGCTGQIAHIRTIAQRGTSADRQLACYHKAKAAGADETQALRAVVLMLVEQTMAGT
ncbi:MAG: carboxylate-amine ligase, partial [Alphaproteobacteria bacterium]